MSRKSLQMMRIWFRLMSGLLLFMMVPHKVAASHYAPTPIRQNISKELQHMLEERVASLHLSGAVRSKRLAIALVDITDPSAPKLAQLNGDEMMYAASLPKIAILLAAFERIRAGKLPLNDELRQTMTRMIRYSSNAAATEMIHKVGGEYINEVLESPKYRLYDPRHNGGLWVGKEYAGSKAFHRDPLHHLSHGATAVQVARFYYMLETGQLVSPRFSHEMKRILSRPGISHKFVKGLQQVYPDVQMYRKSGTWRQWHADSALIEHGNHRYIAVALAHDPHGGDWMKKLIREMDEIIAILHEQDEGAPAGHAAA